LNRPRKELHVVDEKMFAAMVDRLAGPRGRDDLERFVEHLAARAIIELLTRLRELSPKPVAAQTDPEDEAAAAEPVQRRGLPCDLGGSATSKRG
jgi:hypothetical protein